MLQTCHFEFIVRPYLYNFVQVNVIRALIQCEKQPFIPAFSTKEFSFWQNNNRASSCAFFKKNGLMLFFLTSHLATQKVTFEDTGVSLNR